MDPGSHIHARTHTPHIHIPALQNTHKTYICTPGALGVATKIYKTKSARTNCRKHHIKEYIARPF